MAWQKKQRVGDMKTVIQAIMDEQDYFNIPYFKELFAKRFLREDFIETQIQFYFAVVFFSRPMAALAAKIPTPNLRVEVLRNVWEEHGEGDINAFHANTFLTFLERLGSITAQDVEKRALWPEVRIFNTTLIGSCVLDEYLIGASLLGMIEYMFCHISATIAEGIIANSWLKTEQMIHYNLHKDLDVKHSQDFFNVLKPRWESSKEDRYIIEQGLRLGATLFANLYHGLYRQRSKRMMREVSGPHTRA
jgi:pyrroloquinoline-quinone synthase